MWDGSWFGFGMRREGVMRTEWTASNAVTRSCLLSCLLFAAATLVSVFSGFGLGIEVAELVVEHGQVEIRWLYDEDSWELGLGVGAILQRPSFSLRLPGYEQSGILGGYGWKTKWWSLRSPVWLPCIPLGLVCGFLMLWTRGSEIELSPGRILRLLLALTVALVVGLMVATAVCSLTSRLPKTFALGNVALRVLVPIAVSTWPARLAYRWIARPRPRPAGARCKSCGYNLTGNVSGVCPECGAPRGSLQSADGPRGGFTPAHVGGTGSGHEAEAKHDE